MPDSTSVPHWASACPPVLVTSRFMYFPYLWCRQEEALAIVELATAGLLAETTVPIFVPVDTKPSTESRIEKILAGGGRIALVVNSASGRPAPKHEDVKKMLAGKKIAPHASSVFPAFELRGGMALGELQTFAGGFTSGPLVVVHRDHTHSAADVNTALGSAVSRSVHIFVGRTVGTHTGLAGLGTVLLRDDFQHRAPNGAYPNASQFGDLVFQYRALGHKGFGDFATVGDRPPTTGGGAAKHVALHLTYPAQGSTIHCQHFVSGPPGTKGDTATKYLHALAKLTAATGSPPTGVWSTLGSQGFASSHTRSHFPGLGQPKRWSIMHHIEITQRIMTAASARAFI
ncbi:MAG: sce7725 family protein [Nannocystaceae bacterium]|nr:sce7725 family protein [bacterium]